MHDEHGLANRVFAARDPEQVDAGAAIQVVRDAGGVRGERDRGVIEGIHDHHYRNAQANRVGVEHGLAAEPTQQRTVSVKTSVAIAISLLASTRQCYHHSAGLPELRK